MKPSRLSSWLRVCVLLALSSFTAYACGGSQFTATGGSNGGGGTLAGATGSGGDTGSGASGGVFGHKIACEGPEDCDDRDPCTVDQCGADGVCTRASKCDATEKCCDGACGQCCYDTDCDDGVKCTDDLCFAGGCSHSPNNTLCAADEYCSVVGDCRRKEACVDNAGCNDSDPCTDDACATALCDHTATKCAGTNLCCPGIGCSECCEDSQCNDGDPCTTDSCSANKCTHAALCEGNGQKCCPHADNISATCGTCCAATDCDDNVKCTKDSCTQGTCGHTADSAVCGAGFSCDPVKDCYQTAQCLHDTDCKGSACQTGSCVGGKCSFASCKAGTKCCAAGCKACCADTDCNDGIACTKDACREGTCTNTADNSTCTAGIMTCDPANGGCIECKGPADCDDKSDCTVDTCDLSTHKCAHKASVCSDKGLLCCGTTCAACCGDADCQGGVTTAAAPQPIGGGKCLYKGCISGTCGTKSTICPIDSGCCTYGCCGIATNAN